MQVIEKQHLNNWLETNDNWKHENGEIVTERNFDTFADAFQFIGKVAVLAEERQHHPKIENEYTRVRLSMTTHDADNQITDKDLKMAEAIDR